MRDPKLRDELVARVHEDWDQGEAFFAAVGADPRLEAELERLLENPSTPLLVVLEAWDSCPEEGVRLIEVTAANATRLGAVVEESGWPGLGAVGALGADAAWLIAQHADLGNDLRRRWLAPLGTAVEAGETDPRHLACLVDRIAVVAGDPQTYGTVVVLESGRPSFPHPLHDPTGVDQRRAAIGVPPLEAEVPLLVEGDIVPFGSERPDHPLFRWPADPR